MGQVEASWAHPAERGFKLAAELVGTAGRLNWDYDHIIGGTMHVKDGETTWFDPLGDRGFGREVTAFVEAIGKGGPAPVPVEEGFEATRTALAAKHSAATGQPVDLTSWEVL
jgi:myo-inositol 2-dehydrogenase/D-chiro-inositol 1-dehydrogenase